MAVAEGRLAKEAEKASIPEILQKLELLDNERLTNAAIILFCKTEHKQFMQSSVQLARFEGITKTVFIDRKDVRGNVFDLLEDTMKFLRFNLPIAGKITESSPYRVDTPAIPFNVLREAILNALVHRDYGIYGGSVDVAVYDDRVEIDNPGKLPTGIKVSDLTKKHKSIKRNPLIAKVLYTCGMIEQWGRGTLEMIKLCKEAGNPAPKFEESAGSFSVTFPLREPLSRIAHLQPFAARLTERQQEIISILKHGPHSVLQIVDKMSMRLNERTLQRELAMLKKIGLINPIGRARSTLWSLSDKNRDMIAT